MERNVKRGDPPREIIKRAAQLGFIRVFIKKEYGALE
jgi:alkylation response protein AidB-like acyl-CoA dehydrogenase